MASFPMHAAEQAPQHALRDRELDVGGADLDSAVAVQLIAKTTTLSISGLGSEAQEGANSGNGSTPPGVAPAETAHSLALPCHSDAQPHAATMDGRREDALGATSTVATGVTSASGAPATETASSTGAKAGESSTVLVPHRDFQRQLVDLPNELLLHILGYLEVCDLLAISRTSHHLRSLSLHPYLHHTRLRRTRVLLPPLLASPQRPSKTDLIRRSIFLTHTTFASRRLARSLASIRLAHRLARRPSAEALVQRCVLPPECLAGGVAPALVARKRAVERERVKDGLRGWVGSVFRGEVRVREEGVKKGEERTGVGRVWRLRRFWEGVGKGQERATSS